MAVLDKFIRQKELIGFKLESTPYTAETLANADYNVLCRDISVSPNIEMFKRKYAVGDYDNFEAIPGKRDAEVSFTVDIQGSGAAATAPKHGKFLRASGFRETVGGSGVVYTKDANMNSVPGTLEIVFKGTGAAPSGIKIKLRGVMFDAEIKFDSNGEAASYVFNGRGVIVGITDLTSAQLPGATGWDTTVPPSTLSAVMNFRGYPINANSMSVKLQNQIEMLTDLNAAEGYEGAYIVDAEATAAFNPYLAKASDQMFWPIATGETGPLTGKWEFWAGATGNLGNHFRIDAWNAQIIDTHKVGVREGTEENPIEVQFNRGTTGAPMLQITYGSWSGIAGF